MSLHSTPLLSSSTYDTRPDGVALPPRVDRKSLLWSALRPMAFPMAAAGAVVIAGDWNWLTASLAIGLVAAGAVMSKIGIRAGQVKSQAAIDNYLAAQQRFGAQVAPIWSAHIENSRQQMESAITALAERFSGIVDKLDAAVRAAAMATKSIEDTGKGGGNSLVEVFAKSERELGAVVASQKSALTGITTMLVKIQGLDRFTEELQEMAADVAKIAAQANLLSLNAAIEAARAGEMGRGFSVVAKEFRMLSNQSAETGRHISEKVGVISAAISAACRTAEESVKQEGGSTHASEQAIDAVLTGFREVTAALLGSSSLLKDESIRIKAEIGDVLVQLQFQDRVSQMLTHVEGNIEHLPEFLAQHREHFLESGNLEPLDPEQLLDKLKSAYATVEQHQIHQGNKAEQKNDSEVTFF